MGKSISLEQWLVIGIMLVICFFLVLAFMKRPPFEGKTRRWSPGRRVGHPVQSDTRKPAKPDPEPMTDRLPGQWELVELSHQLFSSVMRVLNQVGERGISRQELVDVLAREIYPYRKLSSTGFREGIENLVKHQCESVCSICLSVDDLNLLWKERQMEFFIPGQGFSHCPVEILEPVDEEQP